MPRFVILRHDFPASSQRPLHWDLMLESQDSLLTWALREEPTIDRPIDAEQLSDHRIEYLDYEGPVAGDRGTVRRWDHGEFEWQKRHNDECIIVCKGKTLDGIVRLQRSRREDHWWLIWFSDDRSRRTRCTTEE